MPIAPTPSAEDSQAGSAWLLFGEAAKALREGQDVLERDRLLNNAYRGLQAYDPALGDLEGMSGLYRPTREAIAAAFEQTSPGVPRAHALEKLIERMRAVVMGEGGAADDVDHLARFFECARESLDQSVSSH